MVGPRFHSIPAPNIPRVPSISQRSSIPNQFIFKLNILFTQTINVVLLAKTCIVMFTPSPPDVSHPKDQRRQYQGLPTMKGWWTWLVRAKRSRKGDLFPRKEGIDPRWTTKKVNRKKSYNRRFCKLNNRISIIKSLWLWSTAKSIFIKKIPSPNWDSIIRSSNSIPSLFSDSSMREKFQIIFNM